MLVAAFLVLAGCGADDAIHADPAFTADERASIQAGHVWLAEHVGREPAPIAWDGDDIHRGSAPGSDRPGATNGAVYLVTDSRGVTPENLSFLAAHELGHYLYGFADDYGDTGLMGQWERGEWSSADRAQCQRLVANGNCK